MFQPFAIFGLYFGEHHDISDEIEIDYNDLLEPEPADINDVLEPGMIIWVETPAYGWREGVVEFIDKSPNCGEDFDRAYVTALPWEDQWADYVATGEFLLFAPMGW